MDLMIPFHNFLIIKKFFLQGCECMLMLTRFIKKKDEIEFNKESTSLHKTLQANAFAASMATRLVR